MSVDGRDDGFDRHRIYHLLEGVILPVDLFVILEMEYLAPLVVVLNFRVEELRPFDGLTVEVLDPGGKTHFGLSEHAGENRAFPPIRW